MIKLDQVTREYQMGTAKVVALDEINLEIEKGEYVGIKGPSGSGKSTFLNIVGFLDRPTKGKYYFHNKDTTSLKDNELAEIRNTQVGFVFQTFNLLPKYDALHNVELPLIYSGISGSERKARAKEALESVGLGHRLSHNPNELSGGQRQRVAIARALVNSPDIILADEPTGNLDTKTGKGIMEILNKLHSESKTVILISHEKYIVKQAHRVINLIDGEIVEEGKYPFNAE